MQPQLTKPQWCSLAFEIREKLREIFKIPRSEGAEVIGNTLVSDGTSHVDLTAINVASMQEYLNSTETDFAKLFDEVMSLVDPKPAIVTEGLTAGQIEVMPEEPVQEHTAFIAPDTGNTPEPIPNAIKDFLEARSLNANNQQNVKTEESSAE